MVERALSSDGVPIRFEVLGSGAPALVFVHGWSCDRAYWEHQRGVFAARHQVVTIDLAGHGESGAGRESWTMAAFGEDVMAVADQLALDAMVLIGHSMGGDVIVEAALRMPDRVRGLVWVDTYSSLGQPRTPQQIESLLTPFRADFAGATREFVRGMFPSTAEASLVERVVVDMAAAPPRVALAAMEQAFGCEPAIVAGLRNLAKPVVAINADYRPSDVEALRRHGVETVMIPGVGHLRGSSPSSP